MDAVTLKRFQDKGIWIFVCLDLSIFFLLFLVFIQEKNSAYELFSRSQVELNEVVGFLNTLMLITSSWLLVISLKSITVSERKAKRYLGLAIVFGSFFCALKVYEYYEKFRVGISVVENTFFTFYYLLTFIHFCHVIAGLVALVMLNGWISQHYKSPEHCREVGESIGIYWHMVDMLWVMLFMMLYLLR